MESTLDRFSPAAINGAVRLLRALDATRVENVGIYRFVGTISEATQ